MQQLNGFVVVTGDEDPCQHEIMFNEARCEPERGLERFDGLRGRVCPSSDMERSCQHRLRQVAPREVGMVLGLPGCEIFVRHSRSERIRRKPRIPMPPPIERPSLRGDRQQPFEVREGVCVVRDRLVRHEAHDVADRSKLCRRHAEEDSLKARNAPNDSAIHAALRLYRAMGMREIGLPDAATALLSETLRRAADRPAELLHALRYERALAYEAAGQPKRARADLERLYAEAPDYEDVAKRLGMTT